MAYREALEARFGEQPDNALVFQVLSKQGPLWYEDGFPVEWSEDHYKRWTARVWRPARQVAAQGARHRGLDRGPDLLRAAPQRDLDRAALHARDDQGRHEPAHAGLLRRPRRPDHAALLRACDRSLPQRAGRSISRRSASGAREQVKAKPFTPADKPPGPAARGAAPQARPRSRRDRPARELRRSRGHAERSARWHRLARRVPSRRRDGRSRLAPGPDLAGRPRCRERARARLRRVAGVRRRAAPCSRSSTIASVTRAHVDSRDRARRSRGRRGGDHLRRQPGAQIAVTDAHPAAVAVSVRDQPARQVRAAQRADAAVERCARHRRP